MTTTVRFLVAIGGLTAAAASGIDASGVSAALELSVARFQPGVPFHAGLRLRMPEGSHTYWLNPGDSGLATTIRWTLPEGFRAGPIRWPAPKRFVAGGLASFGYDGEVILPIEIVAPPDWPAGRTAALAARVDWLECRETCVPGRADLELRIAAADRPEPSADAPAIARALEQVPRTDPAVRAEAVAEQGVVRLRVAGLAGREPSLFIPEAEGIVRAAASPPWRRQADGAWETRLPVERGIAPPDRLAGVLRLRNASEPETVRLEFAVAGGTVRGRNSRTGVDP